MHHAQSIMPRLPWNYRGLLSANMHQPARLQQQLGTPIRKTTRQLLSWERMQVHHAGYTYGNANITKRSTNQGDRK
jgi:hypothetical protein